MSIPRVVLCSIACVALVAPALGCGSSHSGAKPEGDAAADDGGGAEGATGVGAITFSQQIDGGGTFFAGFGPGRQGPASNCSVVDAGPCVTTVCKPAGDAGATDAGQIEADTADGDMTDGDTTDAPASVDPNAGTLTVSGGLFGTSGVAVAPDKGGTYLYVSTGALFATGDVLGVSAVGDEVASFPKQTVTAAPAVELIAPAAANGKITIATGQPLTVSWTGGQSGAQMVLAASALFTSGGVASTTCVWDAAPGTGMAPSAALTPLAAANARISSMSWYQQAQARFTAGRYGVTMSAYYAPQSSLASFE